MGFNTCLTISGKPKNEDAVSVFSNEVCGFKGVIVSDGVGSMPGCNLASGFVVENLKQQLEKAEIWPIDFDGIFAQCQNELFKYANDIKSNFSDYSPETHLGATVIIGIETSDCYLIAYLGNGSAWHIRGDFNNFNKACTYFPWNAVNVLNPHTVQSSVNNKEALFKLFFPAAELRHIRPSVIQIRKDGVPYGDLLIISTDGIFSEDQAELAKWKGKVCKFIDLPMDYFFKYLELLISNKPFTEEKFHSCFNDYLKFLSENKMLDDDASIGILLSDEMIHYHS
jgi:hypothetical protein